MRTAVRIDVSHSLRGLARRQSLVSWGVAGTSPTRILRDNYIWGSPKPQPGVSTPGPRVVPASAELLSRLILRASGMTAKGRLIRTNRFSADTMQSPHNRLCGQAQNVDI